MELAFLGTLVVGLAAGSIKIMKDETVKDTVIARLNEEDLAVSARTLRQTGIYTYPAKNYKKEVEKDLFWWPFGSFAKR